MFGMLKRHGAERRAERQEVQTKLRQTSAKEVRDALAAAVQICDGETATFDQEWPLLLRPGERIVYAMRGAALLEPRRGPGHWTGGSAGVSIPTGIEGIRLRFGKTRGTFQAGEEKPTLIDQGDATITTERVVFQGPKYTREWEFSKLIGVMNPTDAPWSAIQVRNRQKTSGIGYPPGDTAALIRTQLSVAIAIYSGDEAEMIEDLNKKIASLDAEIAALDAQIDALEHPLDDKPKQHGSGENHDAGSEMKEPSKNDAAPAASPRAAWFNDPLARHELRYWNGQMWTEYVADAGQRSQDPLPSANPTSGGGT
jgi:hypothetical protein